MTDRDEESGLRVYEIGYLVLPTIAEDALATTTGELVSLIEKHGAMISQEAPKRIDLAYPIAKHVARKRNWFESAYFGWVKFETEPASLALITEAFRDHEAVLRFLASTTTRHVHVPVVRRRLDARKREEGGEEMDAEKIDAQVDALIASTEEVKV